MHPDELARRFADVFGAAPDALAAAPGRVNLIGEHVDYNDGIVLPLAIDREVVAAGRLTGGKSARLHSADFGEAVEIVLSTAARRGDWTDYPVGVLLTLRDAGVAVDGVEIALTGNVPRGAGLSSSAAVEVAVGTLVNALAAGGLSAREIAQIGQRAENEFVGTRCGIMDQFASALCREGHVLRLDCRSLETTHVPLALPGIRVVVFDTRVERRLAGSAYNDRRAECEQALSVIRETHPEIASLRDVTPALLADVGPAIPEIPRRRARHVVDEIARVRRVCELLEAGDAEAIGEILCRSHASLRDLYEVSCAELDVAQRAGTAIDGVLGGRLTGAGFGGCLVFLVRDEAVGRFEREVADRYREQTGRTPAIYVTGAAPGARLLPAASAGGTTGAA